MQLIQFHDLTTLLSRQQLRFSLPGVGPVVAEAVRIGQPDSSNVLWSGVLQKSRMLFFFIVVNGDVAGMIHTQRETFAIKPLGAGHHVLIHLDPSKFGPVDPHEAVPKNQQNQNPDRPASGRELSKSTSPPVIDLLVAYTQAVLDANPNIWSLIAASEASANEILSNSGNDERVEVVHTVQVSYTEFGNAETDCNRLQNPSDGYMDNIHSLRDQYGADVVVLLIDDGGPPGSVRHTMYRQAMPAKPFACLRRVSR